MSSMKSNPSLPTLHPRTGLFSICVVVAFLAVTGLIQWFALSVESSLSTYPAEYATAFFLIQLGFIGFLLGAASGLIWMATRLRNPWQRYLVRGIVVVCAAWLLNLSGTSDWMRNLSNTLGLALSQCTVFTILKVPSWRPSAADRTEEMPQRRQFLISDVIIATTGTAALLATVRRYVTPIADADYWAGAVIIFVIGPIIASCIHLSVLKQSAGARLMLAFSALALALIASIGLAIGQIQTDRIDVSISDVAKFYLAVLVGYVITLAVFAMAGRREATRTSPSVSDGFGRKNEE